MMNLNLSQIKPIPGFDSLKWKREAQMQIYEETKGMTREEVRERLRHVVKQAEQHSVERESMEVAT